MNPRLPASVARAGGGGDVALELGGRCWASPALQGDIVNYADDVAVLGRAPVAVMLAAVEALMKRLKLPMNVEKTRCCRVPEESMTFLGYRIGRNYWLATGAAYIGTRPSRASVQSICRRVSELTTPRYVRSPVSGPRTGDAGRVAVLRPGAVGVAVRWENQRNGSRRRTSRTKPHAAEINTPSITFSSP